MTQAFRIFAWIVLGPLLFLIAVLVAAYGVVNTEPGRAFLVSSIEQISDGAGQPVRIGRIEGHVPFDMTIHDIAVADEDGQWFGVDRARLAWSPAALLEGLVHVDRLELGTVTLDRLPTADDEPAPEPAELPTLPDLPFDVELAHFSMERFTLGEAVAGQPIVLSAAGGVRLGDPARGIDIDLDLSRLDAIPADVRARLSYVPETERLSLDVTGHEDADGVLPMLLGLEPGQDIRLEAQGEGTLEEFDGTLALDGGPDLNLAAVFDLKTENDETLVSLEADGRIIAVVPTALRDLFDGDVDLDTRLRVADGGERVTIEHARINAPAAHLTMEGIVEDGGNVLDLRYDIAAGDAQRFEGLVQGLTWSSLNASGQIGGSVVQPTIESRIDAEEPGYGDVAADRLEAALNVEALTRIDAADASATIDLDLGMLNARTGQDDLDALLAGESRIRLDAIGSRDGSLTIEDLSVDVPAASLEASGDAENFGDRLDAAVSVSVQDLSAFSDLAGQPLSGTTSLDMSIEKVGSAVAAEFSSELENLRLGMELVETLLGDTVTVAGRVNGDLDGRLSVSQFSVEGAGVSLAGEGTLEDDRIDADLALDLADLETLADDMDGAARLEARVSGPLSAPAIELSLLSERITLAGRTADALVLEVTDLSLEGMGARVAGSAELDGVPVEIEGGVSYQDGIIVVEDLILNAAGARVAGNLAVDPAGPLLLEGRLDLLIPDLDDLRPLTGQTHFGRVEGSVGLSHTGSRQDADISLDVANLVYEGSRVGQGEIRTSIQDVLGTPVANGTVNLRDVDAGGQRLSSVRLDLSGTAGRMSAGLEVQGPDGSASGRAVIITDDGPMRADISALTVQAMGEQITLDAPTRVTIADDGIRIGQTRLQLRDGTLTIQGLIGDQYNLTASARNLPLQLVGLVGPEIGIQGRVNANAAVSGPRTAPDARVVLSTTGLSLPQAREFGIDAISLGAEARWSGGQIVASAEMGLPDGSALAVSGTVSAPVTPPGLPAVSMGSSLSASVDGTFDLALLNDFLARGADRVTGAVTVALEATGTLGRPQAAGTVDVRDGTYENPLNGIELSGIRIAMAGDGEQLTITQLTARTPGGGRIGGSGRIGLDFAAGLPVDVQVTADDARLINTAVAAAAVDADLSITGALLTESSVSGRITVTNAEITPPEGLPPRARPLDVRERNLPPGRTPRSAPEAQAVDVTIADRAAAGSPAPGPAAGRTIGLNITVDAPRGVFVRGRGLDAEMGGQLQVVGTVASPVIDGALEMRRGHFNLLGNRFEFDRGSITLIGDGVIDPILDFLATAPVGDGIVGEITVSGRASDPQIQFSSQPPLPQDEVLARILFGRATGELSTFQAIQLAQSAAELAGVEAGPGIIDDVRRMVGLDRLDLDLGDGGDDGVSITAGRYVADGVFVGVRQGIGDSDTRVSVEIDLTPNIKLHSDVGTDRNRVGVRFEWDY